MFSLGELRAKREAILRLGARYGVRNVRNFGSVVRGEAHADSDIDVIIELEPGRSLLDQVGFKQDLGELLNCDVDVVVEGGLSPYLESQVFMEVASL
jgi:predicted nucleotidyltransferase